MTIAYTSVPQKVLKQSIISSSTTFSVNNIKGWDGEDLEAADFGSEAFGAFMNAERTRLELFKWDPSTIANSSIDFVYRGLSFSGDLSTEITANKLDWTANETYVMLGADVPQLLQFLKEYIDNISITGVSKATDAQPGIVIQATQAQVDARTATEDYLTETYNLFVRPDMLGNPRTVTVTSSATPAINVDLYDNVTITALATAITSMTSGLSGTPKNFQKLIFRIKDDGTGRAITWGASYEAKGVGLPTTTTAGKVTTVGFIYDTVTSKFGCVAVATEA